MNFLPDRISASLPARMASFLASTAAAGMGARRPGALPDAPVIPTDLHVVTVTPTSFTVAWTTYDRHSLPYFSAGTFASADTEVLLAPADAPHAPLRQVHFSAEPTIFHQVTVTGLEPGRTYRFQARSLGVVARANLFATAVRDPVTREGIVTTLVPPPGEFVQSVAVLNDTHVGVGETLGNRHAEWVLRDSLTEIARRRPSALVVNGDVTDGGQEHQARRAREILDGYGVLGEDYFVTRGNHDRPRRGDGDHASGDRTAPHYLPGGSAEGIFRDPFGDVFEAPYQRLWHTRAGGLRLIGIDTAEAGNSAGGRMIAAQIEEYAQLLRDDPVIPTVTFTHHPVTDYQALTALGSRPFLLDRGSAKRIEQEQARAAGAFLHISGHTHRPRRSKSFYAKDVLFLETAATGEFPCGYTMLDLYTGGFMVTFHRPVTDRVISGMPVERWSARGFQPEYTLHRTDHRNFVVERDLAALA